MKRYFQNKIKKANQWLVANVFPFVAYYCLRAIIATCRLEFKGLENYLNLAAHEGGILAIWHNRLLLLPYFSQLTPQIDYAPVISNSRDGDPIAKMATSFPNTEAIRVAHNARSHALRSIVKALKTKKVVVITPDGPRGPRYEIKPGISFAASMGSSKIFPCSWTASRFWQLPTWDKMLIPKPFSRIVFSIGETLEITREEAKNWGKSKNHLESILHKLAKQNDNELHQKL
ncbi:MAG: lysophospholipid acyltransferase (LPLAT)-like uncharacterized protein [Chlamydiales bacterium]|jgi:lysophospholipid acyltransferase (LPLAT)-like uncharacterized protein